MSDTTTLTQALMAEHGDELAALSVTEALDVADRLQAIAAVSSGSLLDAHVSTQLAEAARLVERIAGIA